MQVGVDYYPEHWDKSLWKEDAQRMEAAGVSIVRVAEFAWCRLEPEEGIFDFGWLDNAIGVLFEHGIRVVIGTPTNTPPNWLVEQCPDVLPVDHHLHPNYPGVRGHRCYNSPSLRTYTKRIVEQLTLHYAANPAVVGWQTDNEFYPNSCNCESCNRKFRDWLRDQYGSLDTLNKAWGTIVWSGEYSSWSQITSPLGGSSWLNPSYLLDFKRFQGESVIEYHQFQVEIIRKNCPGHFVTHNTHAFPQPMDLQKLYQNSDFVSYDYYPNTNPEKVDTNPYSGALALDICRGIKRKNFWIMEQLSGPPGCWFPMWRAPYPGFIRAFAWHSIARGADAVIHFRWRSATMGAEQFWHGLIDHSNVPGRRFEEFRQLAGEVNRLSDQLDGTSIRNDTAILFDYEQFIALSIQPQVEGMDAYENMKVYHRALTKLGVGTDVIGWTEDFSNYKLVIVPSFYLLDESMAHKLENYAEKGGTIVITNRTGVKNRNNVCWMEQLPGPLARCAGMIVEEYDPIGYDTHTVNLNGSRYEAKQWCDIIRPTTATPIGWYDTDFYAGKPAVTVNAFGQGEVYYIGTHFGEDFYRDLFSTIASKREIPWIEGLPEGVQVSLRRNETECFLFVLNLTREQKRLDLKLTYFSVLNDVVVRDSIELAPYQVEILQSKNSDASPK